MRFPQPEHQCRENFVCLVSRVCEIRSASYIFSFSLSHFNGSEKGLKRSEVNLTCSLLTTSNCMLLR